MTKTKKYKYDIDKNMIYWDDCGKKGSVWCSRGSDAWNKLRRLQEQGFEKDEDDD